MEKELVICDTNVFIHYLNQDPQTISLLNNIGLENIAMSAVTAMELLKGMSNKTEMQKMQKFINQYHIIDINEDVSELSTKLIAKYSLSNNLQIPDSLIGATAITFNLKLFTYNKRDFYYLPNIELFP